MNPLLIEQLVNDYLDRELPENEAAQVEELLRSDPLAKQIYDDLLLLRHTLRSLPQKKLPQEFQADLFRKIAELPVETPEKIFAVQPEKMQPEKMPPEKMPPEKWYSFSSLRQHFANPRVWTYPLVVLLVASVLLLHDRSQNGSDPPDSQVAVHQPETDASDPENYVFHPPLSQGNPLSDVPQSASNTTVIEISCRLATDARKTHYMPRLFADQGIASITRESGISTNTIYEIEVTQNQLKNLLEIMNSNKESVLEILVPYNFASFLTSAQEPDSRHKIRFVLKNRF